MHACNPILPMQATPCSQGTVLLEQGKPGTKPYFSSKKSHEVF